MFKYFESLRQKPEPERRRAVLWISMSITALIAIIWAIALGMRMNAGEFSLKNDSGQATSTPSVSQTLSSFFDQIKKTAP